MLEQGEEEEEKGVLGVIARLFQPDPSIRRLRIKAAKEAAVLKRTQFWRELLDDWNNRFERLCNHLQERTKGA